MSLNWREIDLILSELDLPGCFIQKIVQPDFSSLVFELYRPGEPFALYLSLAPGKTRLHRLGQRIEQPEKLQRFAQFLRSRIKGAKITEAAQLGTDRIVRLAVTNGGETTLLWVRLWSGAANIIATDVSGRILDAYYRRPGRGEVSGGSFDPAARTAPSGEARDPQRFAVRELPGDGSFNERVERFYGVSSVAADLTKLKERAHAALDGRETRLLAVRAALVKQRGDYEHFERLKSQGDLIMANLHLVQPGQQRLSTEDFSGEAVDIPLDPRLSAERNAESYYERYKKAKVGLRRLDEEIAEQDRLIQEIARERAEVDAADEASRLSGLLSRLGREQGDRRQSEKTPRPGLEYQSGPFSILVGRSARENDTLLRRHVRGNDWWLHSRDYPGAYVFIKALPGKSIPLEVLLDAGNLALYYSKAKSGGQAELYYTQVKYLRRPREGKLGLVLPTHEKNLSIKLDSRRLDRLFNAREIREVP